ncbi:MAG: stage II sporulation protein M [Oscillospiraceae bacterium]
MRTGKKIIEAKEKSDSMGFGFFMAATLFGVLLGTVLVWILNDSQQTSLKAITQGFVESRANQGFLEIASSSFFSAAVYLIIAFFLGFCAISQPISLLLPFFKGMGLGLSMAQIYLEYGFSGIYICLASILPNALIVIFAVILAARESIRLSNVFLHSAMRGSSGEERGLVKNYLLKFTILFLMALAAAVADGVLCLIFSKLLF